MEKEYVNINYRNKNKKLLIFLSESKNEINTRIEYLKKLEKHNILWDEAVSLSLMWVAIKFKYCKYDNMLMKQLYKYNNS